LFPVKINKRKRRLSR